MDPTLLTPESSALAAGVSFAAAALGAVAGMRSGLIVTAVLTPVVGAKAVVPMISVMMLLTNAARVWAFRHDLAPAHVLRVAGVAIPAAALGALAFVRLDGPIIQAGLGVVLIVSMPLRRWLSGRSVTPSSGQVAAVWGLFGFLSSLVVGAGVLVIPILMGLGLAGPAVIATDAAISVIVNLAKTLFFGQLDALRFELFVFAIVLGLIGVPGTWAWAWLVRRTPIRIHTLLIEAAIVLGGAALLYGALRGTSP